MGFYDIFGTGGPAILYDGLPIVDNPESLNFTGSGVTVTNIGDQVTINIPGSMPGGVTSVFGRTGAVIAQSGDYTTTLVPEGTNLYFTNARSIASTLTGYASGAGIISSSDTILTAIEKLNGNTSALITGVSSVSNADSSLVISPTTGAVIASLNTSHANSWSALQTFGNNISFGGAQLAISGLTTGNLLQYNGTNWTNTPLSSFGVTSVSNSDNTLTISPTVGPVIASLNLANPDTWTGLHTFSITSTATSGQVNAHVISPTYNQVSGNASNTDILINRIQTAIGSGTQKFIDTQIGGASKWFLLTSGQQSWGTSLGALTHILGPTDQALIVSSQSPVAAASSLGGQNLNLIASNAVAGLSVSSIATGGAVNITGGNGATRVLSGGNGGAVNIMGGTGTGSGSGIGGAVNISGGISIGQSPTGSVNIFTNPNVGGGSSSIGSINITGGSSTTSTGAAGPTPAGAINITSGTGGYGSNTHSSSQGAPLTITSGAGGLGGTAGFAFTGAIGGALSVIGGAGSAAGAGTVIVGGVGANLNFTTGAGGNATAGSTSNTGGAAGNFNIILSNGGTGATANGAPGVFNIQNTSGAIQRSTNSFGQVTGQMPLLATVTGINAGTVANTALYTVPAGRTAVITGIVVRCTAASAVTSGPNIGVGNVAGTNNIFASATLAALTTTSAIYSFGFAGMSVSTAAAGIIYGNISTAFTGTSQTIAIDVMGYLI